MTSPASEVRARRPLHHEALIVELQRDGGFPFFRDVLLFAAAVGKWQGRRVAFSSAGGDLIRYETLTGPSFADALVGMIAVNELPGDAEVMDSDRLAERLTIFEEYANGGLEYIQEQVNIRRQPAELVVIALVTECLTSGGGAKAASVDELLSGVSWR